MIDREFFLVTDNNEQMSIVIGEDFARFEAQDMIKEGYREGVNQVHIIPLGKPLARYFLGDFGEIQSE